MISDSEGPVERLNSRSTLGCNSSVFVEGLETFLLPGAFSLPRWRVKSNSSSIEDSSSVSLADDIVQAVAELPLLSDELEDRPSPRDNEEPWVNEPLIKAHLRLVPLEGETL